MLLGLAPFSFFPYVTHLAAESQVGFDLRPLGPHESQTLCTHLGHMWCKITVKNSIKEECVVKSVVCPVLSPAGRQDVLPADTWFYLVSAGLPAQ